MSLHLFGSEGDFGVFMLEVGETYTNCDYRGDIATDYSATILERTTDDLGDAHVTFRLVDRVKDTDEVYSHKKIRIELDASDGYMVVESISGFGVDALMNCRKSEPYESDTTRI